MTYLIEKLLEVANECGQLSRRKGAPYLWAHKPCGGSDHLRTDIIAWLQWCDPNGTWSDADSIVEGHPPMTLDDALTQLEIMLEGEL